MNEQTNEVLLLVTIPNSQLLTKLANYALSCALDSLNRSNTFHPLVITAMGNGETSLHKYRSGDPVAALDGAFKALDSLPDDVIAYALVLTTLLRRDNQEHDTILVEVEERGQGEGYQFAQKYKPKVFLSSFARIDPPIFNGRTPQRFK